MCTQEIIPPFFRTGTKIVHHLSQFPRSRHSQRDLQQWYRTEYGLFWICAHEAIISSRTANDASELGPGLSLLQTLTQTQTGKTVPCTCYTFHEFIIACELY